jgi:aspartyl protease family protein
VSQTAGRRAGRVMLVLAWGVGLYLATRFFAAWEEDRLNPNRQPLSLVQGEQIEVQLTGNAQGHFVASGRINGESVTFLLDTGATDVAIPAELARPPAIALCCRASIWVTFACATCALSSLPAFAASRYCSA